MFTKPWLLAALFVCLYALGGSPAQAEGLTSVEGENLPLGAGGMQVLLVTGTGPVSLGAGADDHPATQLDVKGGVRVGAETQSCTTALAGTLSYKASSDPTKPGSLSFCNGLKWVALSGTAK